MEPGQLESLFPVLTGKLLQQFNEEATFKNAAKGTILYEGGFPCSFVPFIISGVARVFKLGETGREITLYRVQAGQVCVLSSTCTLSGSDFPAIAEAEEDLEMMIIPAINFRRMISRHSELQEFINESIAERLTDLMVVVEEVAFRRMDIRLMEKLLTVTDGSDEPNTVNTTHAQLAQELGSAREVVSRILKDLENQNFIQLGRGRIEVTDREGLQKFHDKFSSSPSLP